MSTSELERTNGSSELSVSPETLRVLSRDLASISYRIVGLAQQIQALTDRANLSSALAAARTPAALSTTCASWAAVLAAHAERAMEFSRTSNILAEAFENSDLTVRSSLTAIGQSDMADSSGGR